MAGHSVFKRPSTIERDATHIENEVRARAQTIRARCAALHGLLIDEDSFIEVAACELATLIEQQANALLSAAADAEPALGAHGAPSGAEA